MYGTVARMRVKRGQEEALKTLNAQWLRERQPGTTGLSPTTSSSRSGSRASGSSWPSSTVRRTTARMPPTRSSTGSTSSCAPCSKAIRSGNDGEIIAIEPASVPV